MAGGAILCGLSAGSKYGPAKPLPLIAGILASLFFGWWAIRLDDAPKRFLKSISWPGLGVWFAFFFIPTTILLPIFESARLAGNISTCFSAMKQTTQAVFMYTTDFDDRLPPAKTWRTVSRDYGSMAEECPEKRARFGYGFNDNLSKVLLAELQEPSLTALLFEMESDIPNGVGGMKDITARHGSRTQIGRADGSVKWYPVSKVRELHWRL